MPEKMYEVVKRTTKEIDGINAGKRKLMFGKKTNAFQLHDAGEARAIEERFGRHGTNDVIVCEVTKPYEGTGKRYHSVPDLPWKRDK